PIMPTLFPYTTLFRSNRPSPTPAAKSPEPTAIHEAIIEVWDPDNQVLLRHAATPKRRASHSHYPFKQAVWDRVALIETAIQHHLAGAYESSIPMILAQIDGMSRELTGSSFMFTTNHEEPHRLADPRCDLIHSQRNPVAPSTGGSMSQGRRLITSFIVVTCLVAAGLGVSAAYAVGAPAIQETPAGGAWGKSFDVDAALVQAERASRGEAPLLSLDWQNDFAIAVTQIQEEFPDHYTDSGIVGTEGRAWVSFMAAAPPRAKSLLNALPVKVEIREGMGWTERDLVALGQSIHYSILDDREVASEVATDIDTATGSVTVSVKPVDGLTLAQADAALASEFPTVAAAVIQRELLATENVNARAALVATSQAASLRIEAVDSLDSGLDTVSGGGVLTTCTAGFTVRTSAYPHGIITAGHCSNSQKYFDRSVLTFRAEHRGGKGDVQWHSSTEKT